jgi:hypothetical protein
MTYVRVASPKVRQVATAMMGVALLFALLDTPDLMGQPRPPQKQYAAAKMNVGLRPVTPSDAVTFPDGTPLT